MHNATELEAETYRLKLEQQELLREIRHTWQEIKEQGTPANIATEMAIDALAGKTKTGKLLTTASDILQRYLRKK